MNNGFVTFGVVLNMTIVLSIVMVLYSSQIFTLIDLIEKRNLREWLKKKKKSKK